MTLSRAEHPLPRQGACRRPFALIPVTGQEFHSEYFLLCQFLSLDRLLLCTGASIGDRSQGFGLRMFGAYHFVYALTKSSFEFLLTAPVKAHSAIDRYVREKAVILRWVIRTMFTRYFWSAVPQRRDQDGVATLR